MDSCKTKYPIMLVHGMGFRDRKRLGYWGRIPEKLKEYGAGIYYGNQDGNASVEYNALLLKKSLYKALRDSGAEKLNIIAHSKGGLEARYLISSLGQADKIASLTTISTPHNGSITVDKLMKLPEFMIKSAAGITDLFMRLFGDENPDTYRVFYQLTTRFAERFNIENPDADEVLYQSFGFAMNNPLSDILLTIPYLFVKACEGRNDGLLSERAVRWTNFMGVYFGTGFRGISHCDEVDLRRRRFSGRKSSDTHKISDITDFYIKLVSGLRNAGC